MRSLLSYLLFFLPGILSARTSFTIPDDTIRIEEISIKGHSNPVPRNSFYKRQKIDSVVVRNIANASVADMLSWNSPVLIKGYGTGGSVTLSIRGTTPGNSNVTWNGLKIDNPMLGQADFSLLPAGLIDELDIYYGGAAMDLHSGATGGVIDMNNKPVFEKKNTVTLNSFAGSFNRFSGVFSLRSGTEYFESVTKAYYQSAKNNFPFTNDVSSAQPFNDFRKHSEGQLKGIMQELYFKRTDNSFSMRFWYQNSDRNLPSSLLVYPENSGGEQTDEHARLMFDYDVKSGSQRYLIKAAYLHSKLDYTNSVSSIDSKNKSGQFILKTGIETPLGKFAALGLTFNEELFSVISNNYSGIPKMNVASITADASTLNTGNQGVSILIRQILHNDKLLIPDFSVATVWQLFGKEYYLKGNFSRTSRIPSLNDLYWYPGGNEDLQNENSYISEISFDINERLSDQIKLGLSLATFNNDINDMIRWKPGTGSLWTAENIGEVKTYGIENSVKLEYENRMFSAFLNGNYSFIRAYENSEDDNTRNQVIYIPKHQANASLWLKYGKLTSVWKSLFYGSRLIEADNSKFLPAFLINSFSLGIYYKTGWGFTQVDFDIDNIFNCQYQTMAYYPLPGRSYGIRLTIQLINNK